MREVTIAGKRIADDTPMFVCAEVGHNHQGEVEKCKAIFRAAAHAGVDMVKLQKRDNRALFTREMYESPYHSENAFGATYGAHREALEFGWEAYVELKSYAESLGLIFSATAFDLPSAEFLARLDVPCFKIASGDLKSIPLIRHVASFGKPVIVSTGGGTLEDVRRVVEQIDWADGQLVLLQCTAAYPVEPCEMNLRVIEAYREEFPDVVVGLSDHYDGIMTGPVSYVLGARFAEKHVTVNHTWKGSDHRFSLEPEGLRRFVRDLRAVEQALGDGRKRPYKSEAGGLRKMAKSLVARRDLPAGHVLQDGDLEMRTSGKGWALSPHELPNVIGRPLKAKVMAGEALPREDVL